MGQQGGKHVASGGDATRKRPKTGQILLAALSAAVLLAAGVSWVTVDFLERDLNTADAIDPAIVDDGPAADDGSTDILLVGSDSRTDAKGNPLPLNVLRTLRTEYAEGANTDTIILVRMPNDGTAAHAVSIPRDTLVLAPGGQQSRISSIYQTNQSEAAQQFRDQGITDKTIVMRNSVQIGRRALVKAVEELTGVRIDHYAEASMIGFALVSRAIGGVEVCLNAPVNDSGSGSHFPAGHQKIYGEDALSFVRQRNDLPRGDLDRIVRQQVFLASMVNQILSASTLTDPKRVADLTAAVRRSIVLDKSWDLLAFTQQIQGIATGSVEFVTIPVLSTTSDGQGQNQVTVDPAQVRAFIAGLVSPPDPSAPTQAAAQRHTVEVFNGAGTDGLGGQIVTQLTAAGLPATDAGNTDPQEHTLIKVAPTQHAMGERIATLLGGGIPVESDSTLSSDRIVVLVGRDYPARSGNRLTGSAPLRLEGTVSPAAPRPVQQPPPPPAPAPITADGVPCIN